MSVLAGKNRHGSENIDLRRTTLNEVARITISPVIKNTSEVIKKISEILNNAIGQIEDLEIDVDVVTTSKDASQDHMKDK